MRGNLIAYGNGMRIIRTTSIQCGRQTVIYNEKCMFKCGIDIERIELDEMHGTYMLELIFEYGILAN